MVAAALGIGFASAGDTQELREAVRMCHYPWVQAPAVKKTSRVLIAHEDKVHGGFGGEIAALL